MTVVHVAEKREKGPVSRDKKQKSEGPREVLYDDHPASEEVARKIIKSSHSHLVEARIVFACRDKAQKKGGKASPGYIKKLSPELKYAFAEKIDGDDLPHFLMVVALEVWNEMAPNQRTAFVDHLLTRIEAKDDETTGDTKWGLRAPEVQEFAEVVERNGKWTPELQNMAESFEG